MLVVDPHANTNLSCEPKRGTRISHRRFDLVYLRLRSPVFEVWEVVARLNF